ncbi:MAG: monomeric [FeFe] hydrogenase [Candidatus Gastranaerophilales bacterium]|nr:monomeric [FeFe] hydrogenase [Candidatus Gastranaerophilales bacterium]
MNNNSQSILIKREILIRLVEAFDSGDFGKNTADIPFKMRPKNCDVPYRCCIYKEREIIKDRIIADLGFAIEDIDESERLEEFTENALKREKTEENPLTVIDAACKGCVPSRVYVTDLCQGCVARACEKTCKFGAITIAGGKSNIDSSKCKNCGMCINACPYNAIVRLIVPCEAVCPVGAISKGENGTAVIDFEKCISCGRCVAACPFGAVNEKSQIIDVLQAIKNGKQVIAMFAPAIAGQFPGSIFQLKSAMLKAGFNDVFEVAQGADITTRNESKELIERLKENKPFMTTSCCAGYNNLVKKHLTELKPYVSDTKTPLYYTAELVKEKYPTAITVFISPCVAKRKEVQENANIDYVLNADELGAIFVGRKIEILSMDDTGYSYESSKQGRNYGVTGGVADAVRFLAEEKVQVMPCIINGLNKDSIKQLRKYAKEGICPEGNLVEVMCCEGGCIGGNSTISNQKTAKKIINSLLEKSEDIKKED